MSPQLEMKEKESCLRTCQCDAGCALDVIIEDTCLRTELIEQLKSIMVSKVLKLDQHMGLPPLQCSHKARHNFMVCSASQSGLSEALWAIIRFSVYSKDDLLPQKQQ